MRVSLNRSLLLVVAIALVPAVAAAADEKKADSKDPNRIICEKQEVLGTRLGAKRVCMTAAEWAAQKRDDRQTIDKGQATTVSRPGG